MRLKVGSGAVHGGERMTDDSDIKGGGGAGIGVGECGYG